MQDILDEWDLSEERFSEMSGLSMEEVDGLLRGTLLIDIRVAEKLTCLGAPARFWLRREQLYREEVLRLKHGNRAR